MFYGEHEHTIDDKKRLILPSKFRAPLAGGVVLAKGFEPSIDVYPLEAWNANVARVADLDSFSPEARRMKRYVFAGALVTELDAQGRVLVPQKLAEHAGLGRDVVIAGVHDHLEIWDRTQWEAERSSTEGSVSDVAERIADKRG
ncbi:MAG TPA: division/cell wall cluster transcriptional repressor MraZ [Gaiellaceae bacterium]|nr:division/cell wall cluster transcriptional repressor MraZ [Gaiellaceae bacterium]